MQEFQVLDEKRYALTIMKEEDPFYIFVEWEHRVTLGKNFRQFMVIVNAKKNEIYIEELTSGDLIKIEDDILFNDLLDFATNNGYLELFPPMLKYNILGQAR